MYIKRIVLAILLLGILGGGIFVYHVYTTFFSPNTAFENKEAYVYIPSDADMIELQQLLQPLLRDVDAFRAVADRKQYSVKGGKYVLRKGMNNNEIVNTLRSGNTPVKVSFNNQESLPFLAGRISMQIEADSLSLLEAFTDKEFLRQRDLNEDTSLGLYIPNTYEFFWNSSAQDFRDRMVREYDRFWNDDRLQKAKAIGFSPLEVISLASVVQKESAKVDERPRIAGVYLNRIRRGMALQADPTVIFALKKELNNFDTIIRRVLYRDLTIDSPYNTYRYPGIPPGPITMPDISSIDAVLNAEDHQYFYFVADVENFGYHKFAENLAQHNRNKAQYVRWINSQNINR
ncbi:endolytic transglycosylase MltG [Muriicola marianensis]|uniref:Endolytic murein transglycosylase n=1 Tax=Muriicola marianensis TaxID=1324801 RepID=A0ABQ1QMS0_9FLAO|nr:endolytic transglycosylase MltG [Muriicola marianensis]GGD37087.1 aminodeoxychorismate lyase [Muriicola marianensis]